MKVLSVEINQIATKICEMDGKSKNPKVYRNFLVKTPDGTLTDGMLQVTDEYVHSLANALTEHKVRAKKVIFSVTSSRIATREVMIPHVKANKIGEVVNAKVGEYFPVDLTDYRVAYSVLGNVIDEKGQRRYRLMLLAAPVKVLQQYYDLADRLGLEVEAIDYMGNSLFQAVKGTCHDGTKMVAKIDEKATTLLIFKNGELVSMRNVAYGAGEVIDAVMMHRPADEQNMYEAIRSLRHETFIVNDLEVEEEPVITDVTASLDSLVNGISRVIDFYNPKSDGHPIEKMYITGLGGSFLGMKNIMEDHLGIPVAVIKDVENLTLPRNFDPASMGDYITCIGAVMHPVDMLLNSKAEKKIFGKRENGDKDNTGTAMIICGAGVIAAVALALAAVIPYKNAKLENERLYQRIEELKPVENVHNAYVAAQGLWTDADNMYELTQNNNNQLVAFIQELEQKMPSDIIVLSMVAGADDVTLNIDVSSKESAAKVIRELEAFDSIDIVQTAGLSDVREDSNTHVVSFSVTGIYAEQIETAE